MDTTRLDLPPASAFGAALRGAWLLPTGAAVLLAFATAGCDAGPGLSASATPHQKIPVSAAATLGAAVPVSAQTAVLPADPRSVFRAGFQAGRDPFFPNSARGPAQVTQTAPVPPLPILNYLKLVGIRPGTTRPMALINRTALAPGEEADVTVVIGAESGKPEVQKVNVRCLEIRRDSVLISIAGEEGAKELRIGQGK